MINKKSAVLLFLMVVCTYNLVAQSVEDSVKALVNSLFVAMKNGDGKGVSNTFSDSAILQTISTDKSGRTIIRSEKIKEFADFVSTQAKGDADERISFETVKVDGSLAIVWTPYTFYYKNQFSHCGVNSFHLVRFGGEWKIHFLIDTRRKSPCPLN